MPGTDRTTENSIDVSAVAAAAAHAINNELCIILGNVAIALDSLEMDDPLRVGLLEIQASAQRSAWIVASLLKFGVRASPEPVRTSFEYLVRD